MLYVLGRSYGSDSTEASKDSMLESATVPRPPARAEYGLGKGINAKIATGYLKYRYHLTAVENGLVHSSQAIFNTLLKDLDYILSDKNATLLQLLSDARVIPSRIPVKTTQEIAIPLNTFTIQEAQSGGKSPLSPFGIRAIVDYLTTEIDGRINYAIGAVARMLRTAILDLEDAEPKIAADIIRRLFPASVAEKLKGGVVISDEPPLARIRNIILGDDDNEARLKARYGDIIAKRIKARISSGLLKGEGIAPILRDVKGYLRKDMAGGAARLVRTEIQRAAVGSAKELHINNQDIIKGEVWLATLDLKICLRCGKLDGNQFKVGKGPQPIDDTHPNCRCLRIAVTKSWEELGIDAKDLPPGMRASMNGAVPQRVTFTKWFQSLSASDKKELLGNKRYQYYKDGSVKLEDLTVNDRILSIKQLKKKYNIEDDDEALESAT